MSRISDKKVEKIKNDILFLLFQNNLRAMYTKEIADEIVRDKEFVLKLMRDLEKKKLVKNALKRKVRKKWMMTEEAYKAYKKLY